MQKPAVYVSKPSDELACQILQVVALVPYGKVASYGQIAPNMRVWSDMF